VFTCRECEQPVNQATEICPYCGADLTGPAEPDQPEKKSPLWKKIVIWGVLVAGLWAIFWLAMPQRFAKPDVAAESGAIDALRQVRGALVSYSSATGGFPGSLEALGDDVRGPAQRAMGLGYVLQYTPSPPGADGRVHGFALVARPGNFGFRNFFTDESGVIRATREDRPATAADPPI